MSNTLSKEKQILAISALAEGSSIRSVERITGIHRDTIMRLGIRVGKKCEQIMDQEIKDLHCKRIEVDEMWGFIGKKKRNTTRLDRKMGIGEVWTWVAIDPDTKLVPCYRVGGHTQTDATEFIADLSSRIKGRVQISTDALRTYYEAIFKSFGRDVDYGQIIKKYAAFESTGNSRFSVVVSKEKKEVIGNPNQKYISTSHVERHNLTLRMHVRRLTRLTNAFSKKLDNFKSAVGLHFIYYNFIKNHSSLGCTPAMAAGIADNFWSVEELVEMAA